MNILIRLKDKIKPIYLPTLHKVKFIYQNTFFKANGNLVLKKAHKVLSRKNHFFWLDFGTLLGVYRDGKLIGHDRDIDIAMFYSDYSPEVKKTLIQNGFLFVREIKCEGDYKALEQSYKYKNVSLDIFFYHKTDGLAFCHLFPHDENGQLYTKEVYSASSSFRKIKFLNVEFNIPEDTEKRLKDTYGKNWNIPVKNWFTPDDALNTKTVNQKVIITYK